MHAKSEIPPVPAALELAKELIRRRSLTPDDAGCQRLVAERLAPSGFQALHLRHNQVDNLWLAHGRGRPVFALLGHTDVVPPGPVEQWRSDPFAPVIADGLLYGRGAADMKGSVAALVTAAARFVREHPRHPGTLALLLTSDEEGKALDGTRQVVAYLQQAGTAIDWCLVGEPTSDARAGDVIKIGRRGTLSGRLTVRGIQGHVAYPHLAKNPVHLVLPALNEMSAVVWDHGNAHFPPTGFQISNVHAGTGADNVIPGAVEILFNFRYSTAQTEQTLTGKVLEVLNRHRLDFDLDWYSSGPPYLTQSGPLLNAVQAAVREVTGQNARLSTDGGTSDGRFIAPTGAEVVELGPVNATIHKINECVSVTDLDALDKIYYRVLERMLS
jgi:succinyl-diaminopimelate desuccinylase